jgi:hypothetical protein
MAADASGNRGQLPDPLARLQPPTVTEKLVPVFARQASPGAGAADATRTCALAAAEHILKR